MLIVVSVEAHPPAKNAGRVGQPLIGNNDVWAAFDPTSSVVWIVTTEAPCFHCEVGTVTYKVDSTGNMTLTPSSFFPMTNSEVGGIQGLAIAH